MAEENSFTRMEDIMMVNGKKIKCMVGENCFTRADNWLMKVIGHMTNSTAMGKYTTTIQYLYKEFSITQTSIC